MANKARGNKLSFELCRLTVPEEAGVRLIAANAAILKVTPPNQEEGRV
jgi:hypothetical protein